MKVLIIDDKANQGWGRIIEQILSNLELHPRVDTALDYDTAKSQLAGQEYDLIFLDIRLNDVDHGELNARGMSSMQLLTEDIRNIEALNFTTPVLLFTASNKIWNIDAMVNVGADYYYIKEHPDHALDSAVSRANYERLLHNIRESVLLKAKRKQVWDAIVEVRKAAEEVIDSSNRKQRIWDKLRIGYGLLVKTTYAYEQTQLLFDQEVLAYLAFWSILDEIAFDYLLMDYSKNPVSATIEIRGTGRFYIRDERSDPQAGGTVEQYDIENEGFKPKNIAAKSTKSALHLYTSEKIAAILHLKNGWDHKKIKDQFWLPLSGYRNTIDFIHPSYQVSQRESVASEQSKREAFRKSLRLLRFMREDLLAE